jgi:spermidine synthase
MLELGVGLSALATIPLFEKLPLIFLRLLQALGDSFSLFLTIQLLLSALVMFLPTLLLGMTFPLVAQLFTQSLYRVGSSIGTSYAANTLGAILGAFSGGFILIPWIGVQNTILVGVVIHLAVGWLLLVAEPGWSRSWRLATGAAVLAAAVLIPLKTPRWDRHVLISGVTIYNDRYEDLPLDSLRLEDMKRDDILYYREGLTATVSVQRIGKDYLYFRTNGKIDGSYGDALSQLMTGYIPLLLNPDAKRGAVIGLGTGMTAGAVAAFPLQEIEVLEIEPAMKEAAVFFNEKNGKVLEDPRVRLIATDGRNYIVGTPNRYDVIASEPSNPWIAGIANLYTREFYEVVKSKLTDDGVFAQWFHNYSTSPDDFRMVFRTFGEAFPHVTLWIMKESDFLLVGSKQEQVFEYPKLREVFEQNPALKAGLKSLGLTDVYSVLGFYQMGRKELMEFADGADLNTDDGAQLEFSAPKNVRRATSQLNSRLLQPFLVEAPWLHSSPPPVPIPQAHFYLAQAYAVRDQNSKALEEIDKAIEADPSEADFYVLKTKILIEQDQSSEAAQTAMQALDRSPKAVRPILALTDEFYLEDARKVYSRAISLESREILPYLGMGNIALHYRDWAEAEKWFGEAKRMEPDHASVLLAWGRLMLRKGEFQEARRYLEQARAGGEDSGTLHGSLGDAYSKLEMWQEAVDSYRPALRYQKRNHGWRRSLGIALARTGKLREAEEKFREVLALAPDDADAWRELGKLGKRY